MRPKCEDCGAEMTPEAQADRDDFETNVAVRGCTCFISAPCSFCTHPGNPLCQEDDEFYEEVSDDET